MMGANYKKPSQTEKNALEALINTLETKELVGIDEEGFARIN